MIKIKSCAAIDNCGAEILRAAIAIEPIFEERGVDLVITSGSEIYRHSAVRSAHYRGDAIDVRSNSLPSVIKPAVLHDIQKTLGRDYVVLLEAPGRPQEHFHIHWSPMFHPEKKELL